MHFCLKKNIDVVRKTMNKLQSDSFLSKNAIEDRYLKWAMIRTIFFHRVSIGMCFICIFIWSVLLFLSGSSKHTIVPASFPFACESGVGFIVVWIFQVVGTSYSAFLYSTFDTLVIGVYFHATAQVNRLKYHLEQVRQTFFLN